MPVFAQIEIKVIVRNDSEKSGLGFYTVQSSIGGRSPLPFITEAEARAFLDEFMATAIGGGK